MKLDFFYLQNLSCGVDLLVKILTKFLGQAMMKLVDNPSLAAELGWNGRKRVLQNFSKQAFDKKLEIFVVDLVK